LFYFLEKQIVSVRQPDVLAEKMDADDIERKLNDAKRTAILDLSNEKLENNDLPEKAYKLKLKTLNLYRTQIKKVPEKVFEKFSSLSELNLYRNRITTPSSSIAKLSHLKNLNIGSNRISDLPNELYQLEQLEELDVSNNTLEALGPGIENLKRLRDLKLYRNKLTKLPTEIGTLRDLKKLDLNHNLLVSLPTSMGELSNLLVLELNDNPLVLLLYKSSSEEEFTFSNIFATRAKKKPTHEIQLQMGLVCREHERELRVFSRFLQKQNTVLSQHLEILSLLY